MIAFVLFKVKNQRNQIGLCQSYVGFLALFSFPV